MADLYPGTATPATPRTPWSLVREVRRKSLRRRKLWMNLEPAVDGGRGSATDQNRNCSSFSPGTKLVRT